jgi:diguanylate cyclase (GGDEF)-like protein
MSSDEVFSTYSAAITQAAKAGEEQLATITSLIARSPNSVDLQAAAMALSDVVQVIHNGQDQVNGAFDLMLGSTEKRAAARQQLLLSTAAYDIARADLAKGTPAPVRAALDRLQASASTQHFDEMIRAQATAASTELPGLDQMAGMFRASFERTDGFQDLLRVAADHAVSTAHELRIASLRENRRALLSIVWIAALTVVSALLISWSLSRRLRRLARRARAVSKGQLDGPGFPERGPREISIVAGTLNEVVGNLRKVEQQAQALASGRLDDDSLNAPVAGSLGESIHATVEQLSRSLRDREQLQHRLAHEATHDQLTGLPNRSAALDAIERSLARCRRAGQEMAVLFLDLDAFKRANDTHGHRVGDLVLKEIGCRLMSAVRAGDVVARLGGDEFVVVAEPVESAQEAMALAERLVVAVSVPFVIDGVVHRIGTSVGVALAQDGNESSLDMLRMADNAVYRAKRAGKGRAALFDEAVQRELDRQSELEDALREALDHDGLHVHYQPVTDTVSGHLLGFEALARWDRPGHGPISPGEFIPVAEQTDLVDDLGRWMLHTATRQLADWHRQGLCPDAYVSVNVSARHLLSTSVIDDVRDALHATGLPAAHLVLEVTETVIVDDVVTASEHLQVLRSLGARIALDDFGTGFTSIGQLWRLPVDIIKIDRSFVAGLHNPNDRRIVELLVEVGHTLGFGLIAEGVEETGQLNALRELACDSVQGFLIARPQPPDAVEASLVAPSSMLRRV